MLSLAIDGKGKICFQSKAQVKCLGMKSALCDTTQGHALYEKYDAYQMKMFYLYHECQSMK